MPKTGSPPVSGEANLDVAAQLLTFDPGLYSVEVASAQIHRPASGFILPSIRLDPMPSGQGRAFVSTLSDSDLMRPGEQPGYLRVQGSRVNVLLTIYKLAGGSTAPELRIRRVHTEGEAAGAAPAEMPVASEPLTLLVHMQRIGDAAVAGGVWAGDAGGSTVIEGFAVTPGATVPAQEIEYQAILGTDWTTPWLPGGEFCGSRGMSLPLLGARVRLTGKSAQKYSCVYWARFTGAQKAVQAADGAACQDGRKPIEALRVAIIPRRSGKSAAAAPAENTAAPRGARTGTENASVPASRAAAARATQHNAQKKPAAQNQRATATATATVARAAPPPAPAKSTPAPKRK